jgi:hypothetical protein
MLVRPRLRPRKRLTCGRSGLARSSDQRNSRVAAARCPICGTLVGPGDALGLIDGELAHAECALVDWLRTPELVRRDRLPDIGWPFGDGDQMSALFEAFQRLRRGVGPTES